MGIWGKDAIPTKFSQLGQPVDVDSRGRIYHRWFDKFGEPRWCGSNSPELNRHHLNLERTKPSTKARGSKR